MEFATSATNDTVAAVNLTRALLAARIPGLSAAVTRDPRSNFAGLGIGPAAPLCVCPGFMKTRYFGPIATTTYAMPTPSDPLVANCRFV